jgi:hypothetical protein
MNVYANTRLFIFCYVGFRQRIREQHQVGVDTSILRHVSCHEKCYRSVDTKPLVLAIDLGHL